MGSDETATATTGGPRLIDVFDGNGAASGPNYLLFLAADRPPDSLRDRSGVGWSPTPHAAVLGAPQRALDRNLWQIMVNRGIAQRTLLICMHRWERPRMRRRRLPMSSTDLGDPRDTSGPRIDRIPLTRPPWWDRRYRELKQLFFFPLSKCPIDLFGP